MAVELLKTVKMARDYALKCNYETSATFYQGLDTEIAQYIGRLTARNEPVQLVKKWELLRSKLTAEADEVQKLIRENEALVSPPMAARLDRDLARPPDQQQSHRRDWNIRGGAGGGARPLGYDPREGDDDGDDENNHNNGPPVYRGAGNRFRGGGNDDDRGSGGGYADFLQGQQRRDERRKAGYMGGPRDPFGRGDDAPGAGTVNENLYGDKDRFAPPRQQGGGGGGGGNRGGQRRGFGGGGGGGMGMAPVGMGMDMGGVSPGAGGAGGGPSSGNRREKVKPPLPKFGGGGGGQQGQGNKPGGKAGGKKNKEDQVLRYQGRPGDEELVQQLEADMIRPDSEDTGGAKPVSFSDVAGQDDAKRLLEEAVVYPILMPDYYQGIRRPWKGVMLYGPPGTGKTMLAKAVAAECGTTFFNISTATLTSKWRGESEKLVRVLFEMARHYAPSTIFIDEIDALCGSRGAEGEHEASRRAKSVLLTQMDGVGVDQSKIVMVLGATNHPWDIDEAMRRRLEKRVYIPLPDIDDRVELFKINTKNLKVADDVDWERLSEICEGRFYSGADITIICRDASMCTVRRFMEDEEKKKELRKNPQEMSKALAEIPIGMADFVASVRKTPSSVNTDQIRRFEEWKKEFEG